DLYEVEVKLKTNAAVPIRLLKKIMMKSLARIASFWHSCYLHDVNILLLPRAQTPEQSPRDHKYDCFDKYEDQSEWSTARCCHGHP
ncbi:unnamed protein product, partial [Amoebophrya sp. A120]